MCSSLGFGPVFDGSPFSLKSGVWSGSRRRFFFSRGFGNSGRWRFTSRLGFGLAHKDDLLASVAMPGSGWCKAAFHFTLVREVATHTHPSEWSSRWQRSVNTITGRSRVRGSFHLHVFLICATRTDKAMTGRSIFLDGGVSREGRPRSD